MNPEEFNPAWTEAEQVDWFLFEFAMIPIWSWGLYVLEDNGVCCALGHCGARKGSVTPAATCLVNLFSKYLWTPPSNINDNSDLCPPAFRQITTPKARILKALEVIAEMIQQNNKGKS